MVGKKPITFLSRKFGEPWRTYSLVSNLSNTAGKTVTGFTITYTGKKVRFVASPIISPTLTSGLSHAPFTFPVNVNVIQLQSWKSTVTDINVGTSNPRIGGDINLIGYKNLKTFRCIGNDVLSITGYEKNTNLQEIIFPDNKVGGILPNFIDLTSLITFSGNFNEITGTISEYGAALRNLQIADNNITGTIPDFTNSNNWFIFRADQNDLSGTIPSTINNQSGMIEFIVYENSLSGTIPNINGCSAMQKFLVASNNLTGSIPNLSNNTNLIEAWFQNNLLTGAIPSLSSNTKLEVFLCTNQRGATKLTGNIPDLSNNVALRTFSCHTNQLTGFAGGSVSATLGRFLAQNNQLPSTAVNAILAAFVAAGRTDSDGDCVLNLGGTGNGAPTGQGITDKATLVSRGWTVTTN
jgi:hypothetical protein